MSTDSIHISLSAEPIFSVGSLPITNSMFTSVIVSLILITFAVVVRSQLKETDRPTGVQNFAEWLIETLFSFVYSVTLDAKKAAQFLPIVSTFFLFIVLNNWLGLLPGVGSITTPVFESSHSPETIVAEVGHDEVVFEETANESALESLSQENTQEVHSPRAPLFRPGTADLNTTLALALISIFATQYFGLKSQKLSYLKKFVNFESPIMFFVGILELISEFAKIISFAFRLFGNIFAGEVLLVVIAALIPLGIPLPFYGLEIFVGFIQALVFSMLTLVFINMATISHDSH
ncbi:MAG: ATP synthase F0 subunit A [Candidatus Pacebacteria bacterium CG10_big_fil_rev_8_21_14_0_10_42_12]|nr:F0F1 ATP synthase subunit A [Candidatus Paceibacterota bacterium]PIR62620.1 MAG: ATP synthase F0 subunit A [Candidatus Pacebacteria bacterium CG10_big_fil_rev_8_21_14_0_10_42_12]